MRSALARTALTLEFVALDGQVERPVNQALRIVRWLRPLPAALAVLWPVTAALGWRARRRRAPAGARDTARAGRGRWAAAVQLLPLVLRVAPLAAGLWRQWRGGATSPGGDPAGPVASDARPPP